PTPQVFGPIAWQKRHKGSPATSVSGNEASHVPTTGKMRVRISSGNRIVRLRKIQPAQIVQRDADAPPVRWRPHTHRETSSKDNDADDRMRSEDAEVAQRNQQAKRYSVEDNREGPCVARVPFVNETTGRTPLEMVRPPAEECALAAVRASLAGATSEGG